MASPVIHLPDSQPYVYLLAAPADDARVVGLFFSGVFTGVSGDYTGKYAAVTVGASIGFLETTGRLNGNPDGAPVSFSASLSVPAGTTRVILRQVWSRSAGAQDGEENDDYNNEFVFGFTN